MTGDEVLSELATLARSNMGDYIVIGPDGEPRLDLSQLTRDQAGAIQEATVDTYVDGSGDDQREVKKVKVKLYDRNRALSDLGRHLGLFPNKFDVGLSGPNGDAIPVTIRRVIVDDAEDA